MAIYNYETEKILRSIPKIMHHFQDGDTAVITAEHKVLTYKNGDWITPKTGVDISLMELNEQIMSQLPDMEDFTKLKKDIDNFTKQDHIYMFLQHDYRYITIFIKDEKAKDTFYKSLMECIKSLGTVKGYDIIPNSHIELWIKTNNGVKMFVLFSYEEGCVYYHG